MSQHDFAALENVYQQVMDEMPDEFTSHDFILALAWRHQRLYIDALYTYRTTLSPDDSPFQVVHGQLAERLYKFADYVDRVSSTDIFGTPGRCARWRKRP